MDKQRLDGIVHRALSKKPESINFEGLENGNSFWSLIYRATLVWPDNISSEEVDNNRRLIYPKQLFIKLPVVTENAIRANPNCEEALRGTLQRLSQTEVKFYEIFGNKDIGIFRFPKVYIAEPFVSEGTGAFVFEDMSLTDGNVFSEKYIPGYSIAQIDTICDSLAVFHYYVFKEDKESWMPNFKPDLDCSLDTVMPNVMGEFAKALPSSIGVKWEKTKHIYDKTYAKQIKHLSFTTGLPVVLVHNDLNPTNILWKNINDKKEISAVLDFQMITIGSVCEDIGRILTLGLSAEDRRKYTRRVLTRYYEKLMEVSETKLSFTLEQLEEEYKRVFPYVCTFTLFGLACYYNGCTAKGTDSKSKEELDEYVDRAMGLMTDIISPESVYI